MSEFLRSALSLVTLIGLALVLSINNILPVAALTCRARTAREGFLMRLGGLTAGLAVRLVLVLLLAVSLRPEFDGLLGLSVPPALQQALLFVAGGFLLANAAVEMKRRLCRTPEQGASKARSAPVLNLLNGSLLVALADVSLAFDSLVVVAGMAAGPVVMVLVVTLEVGVILLFAESIARILRRYPTIETLAICALLLMGGHMVLRAAGIRVHEAVVYAMIGFALLVELIDMRIASLHRKH